MSGKLLPTIAHRRAIAFGVALLLGSAQGAAAFPSNPRKIPVRTRINRQQHEAASEKHQGTDNSDRFNCAICCTTE
jgi:hypothetical protein